LRARGIQAGLSRRPDRSEDRQAEATAPRPHERGQPEGTVARHRLQGEVPRREDGCRGAEGVLAGDEYPDPEPSRGLRERDTLLLALRPADRTRTMAAARRRAQGSVHRAETRHRPDVSGRRLSRAAPHRYVELEGPEQPQAGAASIHEWEDLHVRRDGSRATAVG